MHCDDDEIVIKIKKEYMDMLDKVNNKINNITDANKIITKVNAKVKKKIELINKSSLFLLQKGSWLRLAELNKIDAIIDDALNLIWNMIYKKTRISSNKINIDKHEDIDGYVSKFTDVIINKKNCWKECMNH